MTHEIKCMVWGDLHFKKDNTIETDILHQRSLELIKEYKPTYAVVLGDIANDFEKIHTNPLERAIRFLHDISSLVPLYVIIGNHDRPNNSDFLSPYHPFVGLNYWHNCTIVDKVQSTMITSSDGTHKKKIVLCPYVYPGRLHEALVTSDPRTIPSLLPPDHDKLDEQLRKELEAGMPAILENCSVVYAHQEFVNAPLGAIKSTIGDGWPLSYPLCISGHIHIHTVLQQNLMYIGTPFQHSFGEQGDKTISVFTWSDPNSNEYTHERIDLGIPKKILLHVPAPEIMTYKPPDPTNASIKIIINGTSAEIKAAMKSAKVKEWMSSGIKVVFKDLPSKLPLNSNELPENAPVEKYSTRLYGAINTDERVKRTFERLFGKLSLNPDVVTTAPVDKPVVKPKLRLKKTDNSS